MIGVLISSLPMIVCGVLSMLIALSLYSYRNRARVNLLVFMVTTTVLYLAHFIYFNRQTDIIPITDTCYCFCNPAVYPLYYLYLQELTVHTPNRRRQALWLLPAIVCALAVGILYLMMDKEENEAFIQWHLNTNDWSSLHGLAWWQGVAHVAVKVVYAIQIPFVLYYGLRRIREYDALVESNYSNTEGKRIVGAKTLLILFALASLQGFVFNLIGRQPFAAGTNLLAIPALIFSLLLLMIGHLGLSQQFTVNDLDADVFQKPAEQPTDNEDSALRERIQKLVDDEQLYLHPNLKVSDLSRRLHSNRNYIYNAINVEMGTSFTNYINRLRIDHASKLIEDHPELPLNEIMVRSGFTSSSAFYRNFKKFKGITPSEKRVK